MKKILIVGKKTLCDEEVKKLTQKGLTFNDIHFLGEDVTWNLLKQSITEKVGSILFIGTKNGQTGYLASEVRKITSKIKVFGINIPNHPGIKNPKNEQFFSKINCSTQIFANA
jgi:hypothetical protein